MMNQIKMARPTPWRHWFRCVPWLPPLDLSTYPHAPHLPHSGWAHCDCSKWEWCWQGQWLGQHLCGGESNTTMFQCSSKWEGAGKEKGLVVEQGCKPVLSSSPELIHPQRSSENPPLSSLFTHSKLIHTTAPRWSSENPTAVFAVPTFWAHLHRSSQMKMVIIPLPSLSCPHIAASPVTLAVQSSVIPTTVLLHPLPTTAPFVANTPAGGAVMPCTLITVPIRFTYTILQPPSCNSCRMLPLPFLSESQ